MLSDEVIDKVIERLVNRMEKANEYILKEIARSIKEIGTINPSKLNQLIMSLKYGSSYKNMVKQIAKYTKINQKEIKKIFEEVAKSDYEFAKQFYEYRDKPYVPYKENKELVEQTQALARITGDECVNLTRTRALGFGLPGKDGNIAYKGIKETYYDALDEAVLSIAQGKETFDMAMYRQLKNIAESGLKVVYPTTYIDKNGVERQYTRRLDSAIRMNLRSGLRQLHNENQELIGEQFGADGVEISVHINPAEDHAEAQGKQFSKEEFKKLQETGQATTYDNIEIDLHRELKNGSEALSFRPISEYNCYHSTFSIVLGVNRPQYSNKQLEQIIKDNEKGFEYEGKHYTMYEGTQLQRQIETEMRKQKEVQMTAKAGGNVELELESQLRSRVLSKKYKELCNVSGLRPKVDRMKVVNYARTSTKDLNLRKYYEDNLIGMKNGKFEITGVSQHIVDRKWDRNLHLEDLKNDFNNPLDYGIIKYDKQGRPSQNIIGRKITISINPETGVLATWHRTGSRTIKKLKEQGKII